MLLFLLISLLPVPLFYIIYKRYFLYKPEYIKHIESVLYGIVCALAILFIKTIVPDIGFIFPRNNVFFDGFIKAALVEKTGCFLLIFLLHRFYPNFSIMESIVSAMLLGLGFALVENISYAFALNSSIVLVRTTSSVVLHMTSCGITGYFLGLSTMSTTFIYKAKYMTFALLIPVFFHGLYDVLLITGGSYANFIVLVLIILAVVLEFMSARAIIIMPADILEAMALRFEDWLTIDRQPRYERWIRKSMGTENSENIPFVKMKKGTGRLFLLIFVFLSALILSAFQNDIISLSNLKLHENEMFYLFTLFPLSVAVIILIVGSINPEFIESSIMKIPIISDVVLKLPDYPEETYVTYDITSANCFIQTYSSFKLETSVDLIFECPGFSSMQVKGSVIWENHENKMAPMGTIVKLEKMNYIYFRFLFRYQLFRFFRGLTFNLKLPGFEQTRKFFMRPDTVMSKEQSFNAGEVIYTERDTARFFYHLKKGYVLIYKNLDAGDALLIDSINPGEIFGEMAIVDDEMRSSTAICATESVVGVSEIDDLKALIINNPEFAVTLIKTLGKRIHTSEKVLLDALRNEILGKKE